ncbi:MAG: TIGR03936 family radical SAM-associated protein [Geodermatophilaceae bacterium]
MARQPEGPPPPPVVQRLRLRYAKRGRLRFTSHRDFARAFERALRRAEVPMGYSAGFSPHPKISYHGAAPTGVASEAEYLEIGLAVSMDPEAVRAALDACLPPGLDIEECVPAGAGTLADRIDASRWRIFLPGLDAATVDAAVTAFLAAETIPVERLTKNGRRTIDARAAVVSMASAEAITQTAAAAVTQAAAAAVSAEDRGRCAILDVVVRQVSPAVRPDDVIAALAAVAACVPTAPARATRLAQGRLDDSGQLTDPLAPDGAAALAARESSPDTIESIDKSTQFDGVDRVDTVDRIDTAER